MSAPDERPTSRARLADVFFGETLRTFVREVDCPVVAAVHPDYGNLAGYGRARGEILEVEIAIPYLRNAAAAIEAVVERGEFRGGFGPEGSTFST
jgi:hypothetical protein